MLNVISVLNPDLCNVVNFFERFQHMGQTCLVFEMLDRNLFELLQERDFEPLFTNVIRPIAAQLLAALDALKGLGIVHADIKPDNVMLVDARDQSLRVKLIDFGRAVPVSSIQPGLSLQPVGYRAPEVFLGLPFSEAIDVWGVGCVLAFLYLANNLFPVSCYYQMMRRIVDVLGQPEDHMLRAGRYTHYYFMEEKAADGRRWRLMTPEEYSAASHMKPKQPCSLSEHPGSLDDLVDVYPKEDAAEYEDRKVFVDLLKWLLDLDGDQRISPCKALQHPFVTMSHLVEQPDGREYLFASQILMSACPAKVSADRVNTTAASGFNVRGPHCGTSDDPPASSSLDGRTSTACCGEERPSDGVKAADISVNIGPSLKSLEDSNRFPLDSAPTIIPDHRIAANEKHPCSMMLPPPCFTLTVVQGSCSLGVTYQSEFWWTGLSKQNKNLESPAEAKPTAALKGAKEEQTFTIYNDYNREKPGAEKLSARLRHRFAKLRSSPSAVD
ncbi:homeodomain-interacting protein kinase 1-like [Leuresthes tenuis]|uniref:homeodomain-interacting protein kinase 1-like n=1 Tax=Leuresthes tenuis TaxID=355514 RepID=UPI003B50891A